MKDIKTLFSKIFKKKNNNSLKDLQDSFIDSSCMNEMLEMLESLDKEYINSKKEKVIDIDLTLFGSKFKIESIKDQNMDDENHVFGLNASSITACGEYNGAIFKVIHDALSNALQQKPEDLINSFNEYAKDNKEVTDLNNITKH